MQDGHRRTDEEGKVLDSLPPSGRFRLLVRLLPVVVFVLILFSGCLDRLPADDRDVKAPEAEGPVPVRLERVVDGDTLVVQFADGRRERVRLVGVDAPETDHPDLSHAEPFATKAAEFAAQTAGETVWLEFDVEERDGYGRLLAYVWIERPRSRDNGGKAGDTAVRSRMLNAVLLLSGFARLYTVPPNVRYSDLFVAFQREARQNEEGLWARGRFRDTAPCVAVEDASDYAGQWACVRIEGVEAVYRADLEGKPTFLNDRPTPDQRFTALVWGDVRRFWPDSPEDLYDGRCVEFTGYVVLHRGQPQLELADPAQARFCGSGDAS